MKLNRRTLIASGASIIGLTACGKTEQSPKPKTADIAKPSKTNNELAKTDLTGQIALLKSGEIKASELLDHTIANIDRLNPSLNAVLTKCYDRARDNLAKLANNAPFRGAPFLMKDLKDVQGVRTTYGSGAFKKFIAPTSDAYTLNVEKAGMVIVGKTNTPELGLLPVTEPVAYGAAHNPWDLSRTTGGSSGGAGAVVASNMMPCAQASDGGGSIRIPAHYCGVFGLKPSRGRVAHSMQEPVFSIAVSGCLSRTVRDSALMMSVTEGNKLPSIGFVSKPINRKLKIGLALHDCFAGEIIANQDVQNAIIKTAKLCESLGHEIIETKPPVMGKKTVDAFLQLWASSPYGMITGLEKMLRRKVRDDEVEPFTQEMANYYIEQGGHKTLMKSVAELKKAEVEMRKFLDGFDVVLSPVMPMPAHKLGKYPTGEHGKFREIIDTASREVGHTAIYNVAGVPAMSMPLYRSAEGLPIGSQFIAPYGKDDLLLALAYQLEEANPWIDSYPVL